MSLSMKDYALVRTHRLQNAVCLGWSTRRMTSIQAFWTGWLKGRQEEAIYCNASIVNIIMIQFMRFTFRM